MRNLFLVIVAASLTFGGTFTCNSNDDDDDDVHVSSPPPTDGSGSIDSGGLIIRSGSSGDGTAHTKP